MIALALAAALVGQEAPPSLPIPWTHLDVRDWTYLGESSDRNLIVFVQPARRMGAVWMRYEYDVTEHGVRSMRALTELDCEGWRTRNVQMTLFTINNLAGPSTAGATSDWSEAAPNTFGESALHFGCGD